MNFITSSDAVFILTINDLFNAPITLENWAADAAWDSGELTVTESHMSLDGKLNVGYIANPITTTLHFSANSTSLIIFEALEMAMRQARTVYKINGELTLPGPGRKYTFINGVLTSLAPLPGGKKTLANRDVKLTWENVLPAGL